MAAFCGESTNFDLVLLSIKNLDATIDAIVDIGPRTAEFTYESGTVWRIPRPLTREEIAERLRSLPCIFPDVSLYSSFERLREAELVGTFEFKAIGRLQK